ncbi:hypothetical protein BDV28DRAFT_131396, partial [Aspergillus coremiiformis]
MECRSGTPYGEQETLSPPLPLERQFDSGSPVDRLTEPPAGKPFQPIPCVSSRFMSLKCVHLSGTL